jgi:SAM-dependent methyltransferase
MNRAEPATDAYGTVMAELYDDLLAPMAGDTEATVAFLAALAPGGRALELGVGTGRVAIPLAACGLQVSGIDVSVAMVDRLRAKPGGGAVTTGVGDFGEVALPGPYDLVYVVFNTLYGLLTQDRQVECLHRVADRLRPGGRFVVEAFRPDPARFGTAHADRNGGPDRLDVARHDPVAQTLTARQVLLTTRGVRVLPVHMRYVWPSELDLMARIAGMRLVSRCGGWHGEEYTRDSDTHVSVYATAGG